MIHLRVSFPLGAPLLQGQRTQKSRSRGERSETRVRPGILITLALLYREKGRGSISPTHASRRHADKVDTTMTVPTPRIPENIYGLSQPRTALGTGALSRSRRKCGGSTM